ncbi:MAG: hypothetical protein IJ629_01125 [Clostridia bacterium]|nr:hypothetical protein [Clostridia bacterium]
MATQTYNDGSNIIINNSEGDKTKLNTITKRLTELTTPEKISELIGQMIERGILNEVDIMELKAKGIYKEDSELQKESQEQTQSQFEPTDKDIAIDGNEDLEL